VLTRIKNGGEDVDEVMDDGGAEEEEAEAEAEAAVPVDPGAGAVEATVQNGIGVVDTNVVNTEPTKAISAADNGGND
jgi:hypothetical protein